MSYDNHKNFAYSTVATAPSPATSGTSIVVNTGDGALFPAAPFNVVIWPAGQQPTAANAEVVRVTAVSTDTFTITRAQESSSARTIVVGDQIAAAVTAKLLTDLETNKLENPMTTAGDIIYGGASGTPTRLAGGTSGYVLTSNGATSAPSWQAAGGGGGGTVTPKYRVYTNFEGGNGTALNARFDASTLGGGASIATGTGGINLNISGTSGSYARVQMRDFMTSFDGNIEFICGYASWVGTSDSLQMFIGIGSLTTAATGITMTGKHIGWYGEHNSSAATYKYTCADGTTQNSGTFTGTGGNDQGYIVKSGTTSIKYYYNGTLVGTLTTNLPSGGIQYPISFCASNMNTPTSSAPQAFFAEYTKEVY